MIGKDLVVVIAELLDHRSCQVASAHIVERVIIDDIVMMAGTQQLEEVLTTLRERRGKIGETIVTDLSGDAMS